MGRLFYYLFELTSGVEHYYDFMRARIDDDDLVADENVVIAAPVRIDLHKLHWCRMEINGARHSGDG